MELTGKLRMNSGSQAIELPATNAIRFLHLSLAGNLLKLCVDCLSDAKESYSESIDS